MLRFLRIATSLTTLALAAASTASAQSPEVHVGAILSSTGLSAPLGGPQVKALKLAETDINAHGGVNGRKIVFDIVDDEAKPDVASQLATQMLGKNVAAIICGTRVATSAAAARVTTQAGALQVIMVPTAAIWQTRSGVATTIFQATPRDQLEAEALLRYAQGKLKAKSIAIVHDENEYGTGGSRIVAGLAATHGLQVVDEESYAGDATDFTPQLLKVKAAKPDAILLWGSTTTPALLVRGARALGVTVPVLGSSGIGSPGFIKVAGEAAKDVYAAANIDPGAGNAEQKKLATLYDQAYHEPLTAFAAQAWDAAHIVAAALANTHGTATGATLGTWLESGSPIVGSQGTFKFSPTDHNGLDAADVHVLTARDGHWATAG
jgi:branched-chain amino acid transport system substrate-binding protein